MSDSLVFYWDHGDVMHIVDLDGLKHFDDLPPLMIIAIEIINAGYKGVVIDEQLMSNGRYFQALNINLATHEGTILDALQDLGANLPPVKVVLEALKLAYAEDGAKSND
jgi:hypothetical protein